MGLAIVAAALLADQVVPPSVDFATITRLFRRLFSFGLFNQVTYTVPSGPTAALASWLNWSFFALSTNGPVQCAPSSSLKEISMGERPKPLNWAHVTNNLPKWWPGPVPVSTVSDSWAG